MFLQNMAAKARATYHEYPRPFWIQTLVIFIDRIGGSLLYPFFALYITSRFNVGMTEVGILFAILSVSSFIGSILGGAITDRIGRRKLIIFSLLTTSLSSVLLGLVSDLQTFYLLAFIMGILTDSGGPAYQAMTADLLPEEKRTSGFGIIRVAFNVSAAIGPALGGFIATRSYLALFLADAVISLITAWIAYKYLPESMPPPHPDAEHVSLGRTFLGYLDVFRDRLFLLYISACILLGLVYMNLGTTLGVYLRDSQGIPTSGYGLLLTMNAVMVVLMQFWITRKIEHHPPMLLMAIGMVLTMIGFLLYGFDGGYPLFILAMMILTIGEMVWAPVQNTLVAMFSPEDMRGRYMAIFGFSWSIPFATGPYLAGIVMDNLDPHLIWYICGVIGFIGTIYFWILNKPTLKRRAAPVDN